MKIRFAKPYPLTPWGTFAECEGTIIDSEWVETVSRVDGQRYRIHLNSRTIAGPLPEVTPPGASPPGNTLRRA